MIPNQSFNKTKALAVLGVPLLFFSALAAWNANAEEPKESTHESMADRFKYGSIGAEDEQGLPFLIWLVLPKMFPEYLPGPGGWASLGFGWEPGRELPVGFSKKKIVFDRVAINCAFCHSARVRKAGESISRIYPGGPGNTVDPLAYERFLFACASDPRFTADNVLDEIGQVVSLGLPERLLYRVLVRGTRKALLAQKAKFSWTNERPSWGRGRIDPFNPVKVAILDVSVGHTIGNSDMEPIWNLRPRVERKMAFHWDGLNTDLTEVVLSSAVGDGATPKSLPIESLKALQAWLEALPSPPFEDLFSVDHRLAAAGAPVFGRYCARCHAMDGERTGQVLPLTDEAWSDGIDPSAARPRFTDPHRAEMWTAQAATAYNAYADGEAWDFKKFRSTGGYVNVPLDAIWIRAPYLHNGSVPSLTEMLEAPDKRRAVFYRGLDVYDPERMGFVSEGPEAERSGTRYDTTEAGNSNQGHFWGTDLAPEPKRALLEYLKTL